MEKFESYENTLPMIPIDESRATVNHDPPLLPEFDMSSSFFGVSKRTSGLTI